MKRLSAVVVLLVALPLVCCPSVYAKGKKQSLKPGEKINVNTASKEDLMKLPGVGEVKAEKIISNRPYASLEDLKAKKIGIGDKTLEKWGDNAICRGGEAAPAAAEAKVEPEKKAEPKEAAPAPEMPKEELPKTQ